ncbi:glycoside hydrolase family 140 protein [Jiulongibacter sediminis]|uniref:glycoside hydrolase family 140 protein n=1 Tax=Jiulongibacter sediminis TaxID=1605367 RepID=UPI0026F15B4B|nr:glycoside hydrolase family 140 protein [Jiulongibacter sediminis]
MSTKKLILPFAFSLLFLTGFGQSIPKLAVSENRRFLQTAEGKPFFWLADTGWLLFSKLSREEAIQYLDDRATKGYNVIQVMVMHKPDVENVYGDRAIESNSLGELLVTDGESFEDDAEYDYWDHVEYVVQEAQKREIFIGMVCIWGSSFKGIELPLNEVESYTRFLTSRFGKYPNIVWLNGGDVRGDIKPEVWQTIGYTLRKTDKDHLITYHPFGRTASFDWFHDEAWLDFDMFQSGHRDYRQDPANEESRGYGEDNYRFVEEALTLNNPKPVLDAEPSYEGIPHGLHDGTQPYWTAADLRRYAWWSILAGGSGFTYGHNAIMQFYKNELGEGASYSPLITWKEALDADGAGQMQHLKALMEADDDYYSRKRAVEFIMNQGEKYDYLAAAQTTGSLYVYTYNGRTIQLQMGSLAGDQLNVFWYNPRSGELKFERTVENKNTQSFDPPGEKVDGNDWVLVLK